MLLHIYIRAWVTDNQEKKSKNNMDYVPTVVFGWHHFVDKAILVIIIQR